MKKKLYIMAFAIVGMVVTSTAVWAYQTDADKDSTPSTKVVQNVDQSLPTTAAEKSANRLTKEEFERMSNIIFKVKAGLLPASALEEAQPLLQSHPEYGNEWHESVRKEAQSYLSENQK